MHAQPVSIAAILPPDEKFAPGNASGVGLFVHDITLDCAFHASTTIYGPRLRHKRRFAALDYCAVRMGFGAFLGKNSAYAHAIIAALRKKRPGLIEIHNNLALFKKLRSAFPNTPIAVFLHDDPLAMNGARTAAQRWDILTRADAIYCCSDFIRRRFLMGLEAGRTDHVHVVYAGVSSQPRAKKEAFILYAGHMRPEKGALELAQAAARVLPHFPNWKIVFVGTHHPSKTKRSSVYARAVADAVKGLGRRAVFLGPQPHHKVMELFARAAIAVVPSHRAEPQGRTAIEALASGAALVTSGHGGLAEIAGDTGLFVTPVTADGIALTLHGLLEDAQTLRAIQQQCLDRGSLFSLEAARAHVDQLRQHVLRSAYAA